MIKELFSEMTPIEIAKEIAECVLVFALMGVFVFISTLV